MDLRPRVDGSTDGRQRWPKIVEGTVDDVDETAASSDKDKRAEWATMRIALQEIMHEIERNEPLKSV